jgi:hypothetical protein
MNHKITRNPTSISRTFFAMVLLVGMMFVVGCSSNTPDETVKAKADRALDAFVKKKFVKLTVNDFKTIATKRTADDSWEFSYESVARADLPRFQLVLTITPDGRELWKGFKEVDPKKPAVGSEALKHPQK